MNGCFWHGHHGCKYFVIPQTRTSWWIDKINKTIERDIVSKKALEKLGWQVIIIWECQLKSGEIEKILKSIKDAINKDNE